MSTKIYNGYRLPSGLTLEEVFPWAQQCHRTLNTHRQDHIDKALFDEALSELDHELIFAAGLREHHHVFEGGATTPWGGAQATAQKAIEALARKLRSTDFDVEAEVLVFIDPKNPGQLYAQLFAERMMTAHFDKIPGVTEFNYWNNSDSPEGVDEDEFESRGKLWDELMGPSGVPSDRGIRFVLSAPFASTAGSQLENPAFSIPADWYPDFDRRCMDRALGSLDSNELPEEVKAGLAAGGFAKYMAYSKSLREGEDPAFNTRLEKIKEVLPREVSVSSFHLDSPAIAKAYGYGPAIPRKPSP